MLKLTLLLFLLLPGCQTLGIPSPWPSTEEVTEIADTVAAERVAGLATAIETDIAPLPSLTIPPPYQAPQPATGGGGLGWVEGIALAAAAFFARGIPSKGPILAAARGVGRLVRAVAGAGKTKAPPPPAVT